jgi:hypothetical protein
MGFAQDNMNSYTIYTVIKHVLLTGRKDKPQVDISNESIHSHNKSYKENDGS